MRLEFKFRESTTPERRRSVVDEVSKLGAKGVGPLFPGEQDPELASLYKAEEVPDDLSESVKSKLESDDDVEFAEPTPDRKLIR